MLNQKPQHELIWYFDDPEVLRLSAHQCRLLAEHGPLSQFLGNREVVERLKRAAFTALDRPNHCCADEALAILGPRSSGKSTLARLFAETFGLPLVEVSCPTLTTVNELMFEIAKVCEGTVINAILRKKAISVLTELKQVAATLLAQMPLPTFVTKMIGLLLLEQQLKANLLRLAATLPAEAITTRQVKYLEPLPGLSFADECQDAGYCGNLYQIVHVVVPNVFELQRQWNNNQNRAAVLQSLLAACDHALAKVQALEVYENLTLELVPKNNMADDKEFCLPPLVLLLNEAESLDQSLQQAILKAMQSPERTLTMYQGDAIWTIDTRNVCWLLTAADPRPIMAPLLNQFTELVLEPYTPEEIAQIVRLQYPDWSLDTCRLAARYGGNQPGAALAFARDMALEKRYTPAADWPEAARIVAKRNKIDVSDSP